MMGKSFDPNEAARSCVEGARERVGERLVGVTLYGSAAGGEFDPAHSDLNLAFVFATLGASELEALRPLHPHWTRSRLARPLLLSRESLRRSLDVFPLEYLLIRERHETLFGEDLFAGLPIDRGALRQEVERVLRAQEMGLSWTYLALASTPSGARHWAARSGTAIAASASGLLHLAGEPVPATRGELVARCAARFGVDREALALLVERRPGDRGRVEAVRLLSSAQAILGRLTDAVEELDRQTHTT